MIFSGGLIRDQSKSTFDGLVHVSDWRETILEAMECKPPADKSELDGMSQWQAILRNTSPPRQSIVHNIDPIKTVKGTDERQWVQKLAADARFNINSQSGKPVLMLVDRLARTLQILGRTSKLLSCKLIGDFFQYGLNF